MRGVLSKVLSVLLSFAVLSGSYCIRIPMASAAEEVVEESYYFFYDDFEEETDNIPDNWEVSSASENTLLSVETENGNKYLRLKATSTAWSSNLPIAVTKPGKVLIPTSENSKPILLKLKARAYKSGGSKIRNILQLGVPSSYNNANTTATNEYQLFAIRDTDLNFYAVTADTSMTDTTIDIAENTWCDVQAVIKPSNDNVEFIIGNESVVYEKKEYSYAETTLSGIDAINNITLKLMMANQNAYMDIDDVEIYILDAPTVQLVTDNGFLAANSKVNLKFSIPMNTETLNAQTVVLKNEAGDTVECTQRSYDEKSRTYTIIPDENLSEGKEYTVVLADDIYAKTIAGDYVSDAIGGEKSFSFEVTRSKSTDARLSSIMVNGAPLEGFDKDVYSYEVKLQYAENLQVPEVTATAYDAYANTPVITDAQSLSNSTKIDITAEDGVTKKTYTISFKVIGEELYKLGENLITNPGFEDGIEPYGTTTYLQLATDDKHSGSYAAKNVGRPSATTGFYTQNVSVKGGRRYLLSGWFKAVSGSEKYEIYPGSTSDLNRPNRNNEYVAASTSEWQQVILTVDTYKNTKISPTILSWDTTADYYIDDLYVGELKPVFNYKGENEITAAQTGESSIKLNGEIVNQFGTKNGVESAEIKEWRIVSAPYGISVRDNMLVASSSAEAGTAIIEAVFDPNYTGDDALFDENFTEWTHRVEITVKDENEAIPYAKEVSVSGTVAEDEELTAYYRYYHKDGKAKGTPVIEWVYSDSVNGTYLPIHDAANSDTYTVTSAYKDKFIRVRITPKSIDGDSGNPTLSSNYLYKPTSPTAKNVSVSYSADALGVGDKLTGSYSFYDANLDEEGTTTFRWLRYNSQTQAYEPISGATTKEYVLTHDDADTQIKFEVTPVSKTAPNDYNAVVSNAVNGPARPYVQNVSIVHSGSIAKVSYEYKHPNGVAEGDTIVKWYVNGSYSGDGMSVTASSSNSITVEVTPVASKEPLTGTTVSYTKSASNSGGGGGGGGASAGGVVTIPAAEPRPSENPNKLTGDEANHWGAASIEWALANNYMTKEADNNFCPELTYNREYFLTSLIKMVGIAPVEYKNIFSDINAGSEFSKILQAAVDAGIISADEKFYPERNVSREEVCKIVITALSAAGLDSQVSGDITQFTDKAQIGAWAEGYVSKMLGTGLMQGTGNGEFMPKGTLTKAQTATILKRLSEYIAKMKEGR